MKGITATELGSCNEYREICPSKARLYVKGTKPPFTLQRWHFAVSLWFNCVLIVSHWWKFFFFFCLSTGVPVLFILIWIGSRVYFEDTECVQTSIPTFFSTSTIISHVHLQHTSRDLMTNIAIRSTVRAAAVGAIM